MGMHRFGVGSGLHFCSLRCKKSWLYLATVKAALFCSDWHFFNAGVPLTSKFGSHGRRQFCCVGDENVMTWYTRILTYGFLILFTNAKNAKNNSAHKES